MTKNFKKSWVLIWRCKLYIPEQRKAKIQKILEVGTSISHLIAFAFVLTFLFLLFCFSALRFSLIIAAFCFFCSFLHFLFSSFFLVSFFLSFFLSFFVSVFTSHKFLLVNLFCYMQKFCLTVFVFLFENYYFQFLSHLFTPIVST